MTEQTHEPIPGISIFIRMGRFRHQGRVYFSPLMFIREHIKFARKNDNKLLIGLNTQAKSAFFDQATNTKLIIWSKDTGQALVGTITDAGDIYDPAYPPNLTGYGMPSPWNQQSSKVWVALRDVDVIDFDVNLYKTVPSPGYKKESIPLAQYAQTRGGSPLVRIVPSATVLTE